MRIDMKYSLPYLRALCMQCMIIYWRFIWSICIVFMYKSRLCEHPPKAPTIVTIIKHYSWPQLSCIRSLLT